MSGNYSCVGYEGRAGNKARDQAIGFRRAEQPIAAILVGSGPGEQFVDPLTSKGWPSPCLG